MEARYNRRYNKGSEIGLSTYYDESYLPWLRQKKRSRVRDAESRIKKLKAYFGGKLRDAMSSVFKHRFGARKRLARPHAKGRQ